MTCADVRPRLPAHVYGDLSDADAAAVARHLRDCPACRAEAAALDQVRLALDAPPAMPVRVDVASLFQRDADRRARRWRRLAIAGAALAAGLLLAFGLRVQVAVAGDRVVISWGAVPSEFHDRLRLQEDLIDTLIADADARERRYQSELDAVRGRQDAFARSVFDRFADIERTASALYVAQFKPPEEKPNP